MAAGVTSLRCNFGIVCGRPTVNTVRIITLFRTVSISFRRYKSTGPSPRGERPENDPGPHSKIPLKLVGRGMTSVCSVPPHVRFLGHAVLHWHLPHIVPWRRFVSCGGLMSYGPDL